MLSDLLAKLGDNERLDKEQLLSILEMLKLGGSELEIVKIYKKGDFRNYFDQFWNFTLKFIPKICDPHIL